MGPPKVTLSHFLQFCGNGESAYLSTSHLWVVIRTWQKGVLGANGQERLKQDRISSRCAVPSPLESQWRWSHTSEVHWCRHAGMWFQGQAELEAESVAPAHIVSVWCVTGSLPKAECKGQNEALQSFRRSKLQPLSLQEWAVRTSQQKW